MSKRSFLCLAMVLAVIFMTSAMAVAATIRNKTSQRLVISLTGGKTIGLPGGGTANITSAELSSPNVQALIQKGKIEAVTTPASTNKPAPPSKGKGRY